jgi:hypothetical protein
MSRIKDFSSFIKEAENPAVSVEMVNGDVNKTRFQFPLGEYKEENLKPEELIKLKNDIAETIVSKLKNGSIYKGVTTILLTASTSTIPVTPELKNQLAKDGYKRMPGDKSDNAPLCRARLDTVKKLVMEMLGIETDEQREGFAKHFIFKMSLLPDQGKEESFQYIETELKFSGERYKEIINCSDKFKKKGKQGTEENGYVGYYSEDEIGLYASPNTIINLNFDPLIIPDCFAIYQGEDNFYVTPFIGTRVGKDAYYDAPINYTSKLNTIKGKILKGLRKKLAELGIPADKIEEIITTKILDENRKIRIVQKGDVKGDPDFKASIVKKPYYNQSIKLMVFAPLDTTVFEINTTCTIPTMDKSTGKINIPTKK